MNTAAKRAGVRSGDRVRDARERCPVFVVRSQRVERYVAVHERMVCARRRCASGRRGAFDLVTTSLDSIPSKARLQPQRGLQSASPARYSKCSNRCRISCFRRLSFSFPSVLTLHCRRFSLAPEEEVCGHRGRWVAIASRGAELLLESLLSRHPHLRDVLVWLSVPGVLHRATNSCIPMSAIR